MRVPGNRSTCRWSPRKLFVFVIFTCKNNGACVFCNLYEDPKITVAVSFENYQLGILFAVLYSFFLPYSTTV